MHGDSEGSVKHDGRTWAGSQPTTWTSVLPQLHGPAHGRMDREPSCGKAQRRGGLPGGWVGQDASQVLSGVGSQRLGVLHGGLLDQMLHLLVSERRHGHEGGAGRCRDGARTPRPA
jgi:hypothetical protein